MKAALFVSALLLACSIASPFALTQSREELVAYYQTSVEPNIPKTAKALLGDERINVRIGGKTIGMVTKRGELSALSLSAIENPGIEVTVSDAAVEDIRAKKSGIVQLLDSGGITVRTHGFYTALKVEVMKRIYSVSGADNLLTGKKNPPAPLDSYNSFYVQRARIANALFGW